MTVPCTSRPSEPHAALQTSSQVGSPHVACSENAMSEKLWVFLFIFLGVWAAAQMLSRAVQLHASGRRPARGHGAPSTSCSKGCCKAFKAGASADSTSSHRRGTHSAGRVSGSQPVQGLAAPVWQRTTHKAVPGASRRAGLALERHTIHRWRTGSTRRAQRRDGPKMHASGRHGAHDASCVSELITRHARRRSRAALSASKTKT